MPDPTPIVVLAQDQGGSPPPPDAGAVPPAPGEGQPVTPGGPGGQSAPAGRPQDPFSTLLPLLLVFLVVIFMFSMFGQRRDRKKRQAMLEAIKKHDRVQTVGGVIGSIVEVKPDTIVLKVDESSNTRITFARSAVQQVLSGEGEPEKAAGRAET